MSLVCHKCLTQYRILPFLEYKFQMETSETFKKKKEKNKIFDTGMPLQCKIGHNTGKLRALSKSDYRQGLKICLFLNTCLFHATVSSAYEIK